MPDEPGGDEELRADPLANLLSWTADETGHETGSLVPGTDNDSPRERDSLRFAARRDPGQPEQIEGGDDPAAASTDEPVRSAGADDGLDEGATVHATQSGERATNWTGDPQSPYVQQPYWQAPSGPQPGWPPSQSTQGEWSQQPWPYQWGYSEPPRPRQPRRPPRSVPGWVGLVLVAAVAGALVGSGVVAVFASKSPTTIVREYFPSKPGTVKPGDIQSILASVLPAVVSIDSSNIRSRAGQGGYVQGAGTGMIIEPSGVILTNNHVVAGAGTVTVTFFGQSKQFPAKVIGVDAEKDIALVQVEGAGHVLPVVHLGNSNAAQQGDGVLAIGNALALAGGETVTEGIVSALNRSLSASTEEGTTENLTGLIQTDAPINPGNSGGPLVNASAQVVAMNTAVATSSQGNAPAQNVGFAIAVDEIRVVVAQILGHRIEP